MIPFLDVQEKYYVNMIRDEFWFIYEHFLRELLSAFWKPVHCEPNLIDRFWLVYCK